MHYLTKGAVFKKMGNELAQQRKESLRKNPEQRLYMGTAPKGQVSAALRMHGKPKLKIPKDKREREGSEGIDDRTPFARFRQEDLDTGAGTSQSGLFTFAPMAEPPTKQTKSTAPKEKWEVNPRLESRSIETKSTKSKGANITKIKSMIKKAKKKVSGAPTELEGQHKDEEKAEEGRPPDNTPHTEEEDNKKLGEGDDPDAESTSDTHLTEESQDKE